MRHPSVVAALLVILLSGCTTAPAPPPAPTEPPPMSESPIEVASDGAINEDTDETISAAPVPVWDAAAEAAASDAAVEAMSAFAHPEMGYDEWFAQLRPHLTQDAAETYVYTDPINIPVTTVTGKAKVLESTSAYVAVVDVDTNVGEYQVLMLRTGIDGPWLAEEFAPPPELGP